METRAAWAATVAVVAVTAMTGCRGGETSAVPATASPHGEQSGSASTSPGHTARQLAGALIEPPAGAVAVSRGSGPFETVTKKLSGGAPPVTGDLSCGGPGRTGINVAGSAPSAFVSFAQVGRSPSELLVAASGPAAEQAVAQPIPRACRTVKARAGGTTITAKVISDQPLDIGDGGRIVQTDEVTGGTRLRAWQVLFTGSGYLGTTELVGTNVTRADAVRLARQAYRKAHAALE
ncbi:hypothetical protein [Actinoallomurus iriomotensis]|uniref:hypothetical protein n=1 Tax=Actinoallomurus iriomotensis TaxID=478107 RepID=UPI002556E2BD|nr:hypothetical protein [Actinoallomurus iriomotensis]